MGRIMDAVKNRVQSWLEIRDNTPKCIVINRTEDLQMYFAKNRIWYVGDTNELQEFYKQLEGKETTFWASVPTAGLEIKKTHSGLPKRIINKITDIAIDNYNGVESKNNPKLETWKEIEKENNFNKLLWKIVNETLYLGDGAVRYSYDTNISNLPIIEWFPGDRVDFIYKRGRLNEIVFKSTYSQSHKKYLLKEHYGWGYVKYELFDGDNLIPLSTIEELKKLEDLSFDKRVMWAEPFLIDENGKFAGRGASKFDGKYDVFDSLDEILSQWVEAIRQGKPVKYIPETLLPRDPNTGLVLPANQFDNQYIQTDADMKEGSKNQITVTQTEIYSDKYYQSYITYLDLALQGLISPATLGIDTKKIQDPNASYERQMEKTTLYTRQGIIEALTEFIPKVINGVLKFQDSINNKIPSEDIEIDVKFGEYDSPSFDSQIDTVTKAKNGGIMSINTAIDELYGDSKEQKWKDEEIARIKEEQGITEMDEPSINQDLDLDVMNDETDDKSNIRNLSKSNK